MYVSRVIHRENILRKFSSIFSLIVRAIFIMYYKKEQISFNTSPLRSINKTSFFYIFFFLYSVLFFIDIYEMKRVVFKRT